ncbi:MAG: Gp49 family protein [Sphaerochaetaceae bacterium]
MSVANKVVPQDLEDEIASEVYHVLPNTTTTVAMLTTKTGWDLTGISACVDPANFNEEVGRKWAREDALKKLWPLLGFRLKDKLHLLAQAPVSTFAGRLMDEQRELAEKIEKLDVFCKGAVFQGLSPIAQDNLTEQLVVMRHYNKILLNRIDGL